MVGRLPSGIKFLDELIDGGFPKGSTIMISGGTGTGKSILVMQILYQNALAGKKTLFITFEQSEKEVLTQMEQFGWNPKKTKGNFKIFSRSLKDEKLKKDILTLVEDSKLDMIGLDSVASIYIEPSSPVEINNMMEIQDKVVAAQVSETIIKRDQIEKIIRPIKESPATALIISEVVDDLPGYSRDSYSEFLCDGIIVIKASRLGKTYSRTLHVHKMRYTKIDPTLLNFEFGKNGLEIIKPKT